VPASTKQTFAGLAAVSKDEREIIKEEFGGAKPQVIETRPHASSMHEESDSPDKKLLENDSAKKIKGPHQSS